jgi:hypothetical protein
MRAMTMTAAAALASISLGATSVESPRRLSGSQIRASFAGMELTDEVHYREVYDRDGTLRSYSLGKARIGRWVIEKDQLCLYFKDPDDGCYDVSFSRGRIEMTPVGLGSGYDGILQPPTDRNEQGATSDQTVPASTGR